MFSVPITMNPHRLCKMQMILFFSSEEKTDI